MIRILHTSDIQLDAPFKFLGQKGQQHRQQLRDAFRRIVDLAINGDYDLMLIAGDLFDDNRPSQTTVDFVSAQLGRLNIPVCILPGNHDSFNDKSIYRKARFPQNVTVFSQQPTIKELAELNITVYGNAHLARHSSLRPMQELVPTGTSQWHVAMAHGNKVRPDIPDPTRPIAAAEIGGSGMDYVALGDWHNFSDQSQGTVKAYYSGAPEPTGTDQKGAGYVACVELNEGSVQVQRKRVGSVTCDQLSVEVTGKSTGEILETIKAQADPNLMLTVPLVGLRKLGIVLDAEKLKQELAPHFYHLEISDQAHPELADVTPEAFPEELVAGKFVRLMQERIEQASDDGQRRRAEQGLQIGLALLQGKKVL
ncbi:MAG: exonuclease SbcCD subunit D [Anaerolineae bacterium]